MVVFTFLSFLWVFPYFNLWEYETFIWFKTQNFIKSCIHKMLPSFFFICFILGFFFLRINQIHIHTYIHLFFCIQVIYVTYTVLYLSILFNNISWRSLFGIVLVRVLQRIDSCLWRLTNPKICRMSWHAGDPGEPVV